MRTGVLLDTGPLVAYLWSADRYHEWAVEQFASFNPPLISCEPAITEACFVTARNGVAPTHVLETVSLGVVRIGLRIDDEMQAIRALMARYDNVPMSLADACLVRLAEITGLPICTLDSDFEIYRAHRNRTLTLIMPERRSFHEA